MCMDFFPACMSMFNLSTRSPQRPEDDIVSCRIGGKDGRDLSCGCAELNPSSLEELPVLLVVEPFTQDLVS